ncbi:hypothetical protein LAZ67_16001767 [Cordylochernes scorpioides]|uniref:Uncharacterized protein n=1 Tax=Cordylochernes scorpioides TaxID=51811 RepID=A0ABY6LE20_9ARAC|nr:hypothetical protein LAZ67_16001767 [Cordylochernes scorpioides]
MRWQQLLRNARCWRLSDWLTNGDRFGKIYSRIYRDEKLIPGEKRDKKKSKNEATWCAPSKLLSQEVGLLLTADAGVPPGRFWNVLRTSVSCSAPAFPHCAAKNGRSLKAMQAQNKETREALNQSLQAQNQETREALNQAIQAQNQKPREAIQAQNMTFQAQHKELKESLGLKFKCLEDEISSVKE